MVDLPAIRSITSVLVVNLAMSSAVLPVESSECQAFIYFPKSIYYTLVLRSIRAGFSLTPHRKYVYISEKIHHKLFGIFLVEGLNGLLAYNDFFRVMRI